MLCWSSSCWYNLIPLLLVVVLSLQLFLHSVFGYRGIVLFPWHARLYDRDITPPMSDRWNSFPPAAGGTRHTSVAAVICGEGAVLWLLFCVLSLQQAWAPRSPWLQGGEGKDPHLLPSPYWHQRLPPHSEWFKYLLITTRRLVAITLFCLLCSYCDLVTKLDSDCTSLLCLTVSEVPDWGCDISGQSWWQQSAVCHPR